LAMGHFLSDTVVAALLGVLAGAWVWGRANLESRVPIAPST